jgi:hypothetical protein
MSRLRPWRWIAPLAVLALAGVTVERAVCAEDDATILERRVKAAFLYKFAGYAEWPAGTFSGPDAPLTIGVMADEPLAAELTRTVSGRTSNGRSVNVTKLKPFDSLAGVHIVFIGRSEDARLAALIHTAEPRPVLIVTESARALTQGGMINFVLSEGRVRFEVDLASVERSSLVLSSRLLAVARSVYTGTP